MADITVYALSTCPYCRQARGYLTEHDVAFDVVELDKLTGQERADAVERVKQLSGGTSVPVIVHGEQVIVGFDRSALERLAASAQAPHSPGTTDQA
jgi:glutaredoxin